MNVRVRFFASLREVIGTDAMTVALPPHSGLDGVLAALGERLDRPALAALTAENVRVARNQELVVGPLALADGDELAFLPPVTGG